MYGSFVGMCRPYFHGYGNSLWVLFHGYGNFCGYYLHGCGNFLCVIFMGMEIFVYYFRGYGNSCVGHMFESLLNEFMEMRYFWVDWDIVWILWNLNVWNGI